MYGLFIAYMGCIYGLYIAYTSPCYRLPPYPGEGYAQKNLGVRGPLLPVATIWTVVTYVHIVEVLTPPPLTPRFFCALPLKNSLITPFLAYFDSIFPLQNKAKIGENWRFLAIFQR